MGTVVLYAGALAAGTFRVAKEGDRRAYVLDADAIRWGARRRFVSRSRLSWCYSSCRQAGRSSSAMRDLWHVRLGVLEAFGFGMRHPDPVTPAECSRVVKGLSHLRKKAVALQNCIAATIATAGGRVPHRQACTAGSCRCTR